MRTIALEEHFTTEQLAANSMATASIAQPGVWAECMRLLLDITEERIPAMDAAGLDVQILSLNSPGIQAETDRAAAVDRAKAVNDLLHETIAIRPDRFAGFAALPLQSPKEAAFELERAVTKLGLKGGLINGHSQGRYLDHPDFRTLWQKAVELDVPLYLHPASSIDTPHVLQEYPMLAGPMWSWGIDTASHVLRMVFGGVFDDFPEAKLIVGHMGEGLPFTLWRLDSRWLWHNHYGVELKREKPSEYIRHNLYITTSGVCDDAPLKCAISALGSEHILFATDYPFEDLNAAATFLRTVDVSEDCRANISHRNAELLLRM